MLTHWLHFCHSYSRNQANVIQEITELNLLWARTLLADLNPAGPPKTIIHNNSDDRGLKREDLRCHFVQNHLQFEIHVFVWVR